MRDKGKVIKCFNEIITENNTVAMDGYNGESGMRTNVAEMRRKTCPFEKV